MSQQTGRDGSEIVFNFANGATESTETIDVQHGCFGTVIVDAGSPLIGKTLQFIAVSGSTPQNFAAAELLSSGIVLAAGANALTQDHIREAGAVSSLKLRVDSAVGSAGSCVLLWKA